MPYVAHSLKLVYYDVPKVACTSLKSWFWAFENEIDLKQSNDWTSLRRKLVGKKAKRPPKYIHSEQDMITRSFKTAALVPDGYKTMAVLRDPISRLYSAWNDKVCKEVFSRRDDIQDLENEALDTDPSFGSFLENFDLYREISRPARIHTLPLEWHLGRSPRDFDHIFKFEKMDGLKSFLSQETGTDVTLPRQNLSKQSTRSFELSTIQIELLKSITAADYAWCDGYYSQSEGLAAFALRTAQSGHPNTKSQDTNRHEKEN